MSKNQKFKPVDPKQDFIKMEKDLLDYWYKKGIVEKYLKRNNPPAGGSKKKFSFLDGPITANNPMGVHHAWGRTYKDLWQRFYNMQGYSQRFQNGFDEQGLWVEVEVEKELGFKNKKDIEKYGIDKFVEKCKERVKKYSQIQTEQSKRLGYFMDWDNSYHTSSEENNYAIWNFLKVCNEKGYLYKGRDSVPWCPRCGTAISQHEILTEEYKEITHKAVFVKYQVSLRGSGQASIKYQDKTHLLVWTTTPWTLPSNVAIAVNPDLSYGIYEIDEEKYIIQVTRAKAMGIETKQQKTLRGKELIDIKFIGNFDELPALKGVEHRVIAAKDLVNEEEGTGLVHIAPGAGEEDFKLAKEENLSVIESIDEGANYIEGFGDLTGQSAKNYPDLIIDKLKQKGVLFKEEDYKHRYPTCWRCKTELVWRVVDEWYIAMDRKDPDDKKSRTLRQEMVDVAKQINWLPKFGLDRELDWLKNMHDWLISKKRYWGLTLPIWECQNCKNFEVIGSIEELKEKAVEGWEEFEGQSPHRPWVDSVKINCSQCKSVSSRIPDVGNPWLDAGIVPFSTMSQEWFPADFITESFPGQFKNWFYSLIAMSTVLKNTNPTKTVLGFATLLDEKGEEMHKSKGNAIEFNEAADKIGVDVMRWMYAVQNPTNNLLFGYHKADEVRRRFYLILWNVYSFFVTYANLNNWTPTPKKPINILDRWLISRFNSLNKNVTQYLSKYNSSSASASIEDFIINDLSTWYIRRSRDRVEEALPTLYETLVNLSKIISPFMPFISEEMYTNLTGEESVNLSDFPIPDQKLIDEYLEREMLRLSQIVEKGHSLRKESQIKVRQPLPRLEYAGDELSGELEQVLAQELNVKEVKKGKSTKLDTTITPQLKAEGEARDIIRQIQQARKEENCRLDQKIDVELPSWPKEFENQIKKETLSQNLKVAKTLSVKKL
ncbi:MAG: isoleucine--tRNA ligase [Candidatus Curtissbacteria bacterium]|nr:isoleucine--tRNA ligase [Candidatus Curtissbacteria bacterium]